MHIKIVIIVILFAFKLQSYAIPDSLEIKRLAGFCKLWGLVKYYNPKVEKKQIDWDNIFLNYYNDIKKSSDFDTYNTQLENLLKKALVASRKLTDDEILDKENIINGNLVKLNNFKYLANTSKYVRLPEFQWIKNDDIFSNEIQNYLFQIIIDFKPVNNKYLKGTIVISHNENPYSEIDSVDEAHRMLGLFRYWNIVNYFYPYKNLTDKNWDSVLIENIPLFIKKNTYYEYFNKIRHLVTELNDSHAWGTIIDSKKGINKSRYYNYQKYRYPPFTIIYLDSNIVIDNILNDSLSANNIIKKGDILVSVNNRFVKPRIDLERNYIPFSTEQAFQNGISYSILTYIMDTTLFNVSVLRGNDTIYLNNIIGINATDYWRNYKIDSLPSYYAINKNIGYINLSKVKLKEFNRACKSFVSKPNLIFDMRGYPNSLAPIFIPKYFSRKPIPVAEYYYPSKKIAGVFIKNKHSENYFVESKFALIFKLIFKINKKIFPTFNKLYNGNVIVLINDEAMSYAETVCMIFKAYSKNTIFIGTPTQGANGDVIDFFLPGGISTCFSSIDWHFPDKKQLQRIGIIPDIEAKRTIQSICNGEDFILNRAIQYLEKEKNINN